MLFKGARAPGDAIKIINSNSGNYANCLPGKRYIFLNACQDIPD